MTDSNDATSYSDLVTRKEFDGLESRVETGFRRVDEGFRHLETKLDSMVGTDWKTLTGFGSLFLSAASIVGGLVAYGLNGKIDAMNVSSGERHIEREKDIAALEDALQREVHLLDDSLQARMDMLLDAPLERLERLDVLAARTQSRLDAHTGNGHPHSVVQKIETLEERVLPKVMELDTRLRLAEQELSKRSSYVYGPNGSPGSDQ